MTRRHIVQNGIGQTVGWLIANLINAYFWPTSGATLGIRIMIPLLSIAAVTALLYYRPLPPQRSPDEPVDE